MDNKRIRGIRFFLVALALFVAGASAQAQVWQSIYTPYEYDHVAGKKSFLIPTGCGAPTGMGLLLNNKLRRASVYFDTCNNKTYLFNPKDTTWGEIAGAIDLTQLSDSTYRIGEDTLKYRSIYNTNGSIPGTRNINFQGTGILNMQNLLAIDWSGATGGFQVQANPGWFKLSHFLSGTSKQIRMGDLPHEGISLSAGISSVLIDTFYRFRVTGLLPGNDAADSMVVFDISTGQFKYRQIPSLSLFHRQGGNSYGDTARVGTTDNFPVAFYVNGVRKYTITTNAAPIVVNSAGMMIAAPGGGGISLSGASPGARNILSTTDLSFGLSSTPSQNAYTFALSVNPTSGDYNGLRIASTGTMFAPTSGNATFNAFRAVPSINQTGGANGITRTVYLTPILTSAADHRVIETDAGNVLFNGAKVGIGTAGVVPPISFEIGGTDAMKLPAGTTAQRPTGATGYLRWNTDSTMAEVYNGSAWVSLMARSQHVPIAFTTQNVTATVTIPDSVQHLVVLSAPSGSTVLTIVGTSVGQKLTIKKTDTSPNTIDVVPSGAATIDTAITSSGTLPLGGNYSFVTLVWDGTNWWRIGYEFTF